MTARSGGLAVASQAQRSPRPISGADGLAGVQLARFLLRPVDYIDPQHLAGAGVPAGVVAAMNTHRRFRPEINTAVADMVVAPVLGGDVGAAVATRGGRLAVALLTVPLAEVRRVAALVAAAIVCRRVTRLVLASDRRGAREAMGEEAFSFALEEAPLMFAELAGLDRADAGDPLPQPFDDFAEAVLRRLVAVAAPALEALLALRFPPHAVRVKAALPTFGDSNVVQAIRLILRKEPSWSAYIG